MSFLSASALDFLFFSLFLVQKLSPWASRGMRNFFQLSILGYYSRIYGLLLFSLSSFFLFLSDKTLNLSQNGIEKLKSLEINHFLEFEGCTSNLFYLWWFSSPSLWLSKIQVSEFKWRKKNYNHNDKNFYSSVGHRTYRLSAYRINPRSFKLLVIRLYDCHE